MSDVARAEAGDAGAEGGRSPIPLESVRRWSERAALLAAAAAVALLGTVVLQRAGFPLPLEWMENGSLEHLRRVRAGEPLFVLPTIDFVPFPYPPFYYWLSAPIASLLGNELLALRVVSIASTAGTLVLLAAWVRRESGQLAPGLVAAGLFAASYRASGGYMDVGRVDALFTLLVVASLYVLRFARGARGHVAAAGLGALCMMTKQTTALVLAPLVLWCAWQDHREAGTDWRRWRRFASFGLVLFALSLLGTLFLEWRDGHFLLHILGAQQNHPVRWPVLLWFLRSDVFASLPVPVLLCLALAWFRPRGLSFHAVALGAIALAALVPRIKVGGALNNLIPVHAALALGAGLALAWLPALVRPAATRSRLAVFLWWAVLAQILGLAYDPAASIPGPASRAAGERLVARLRAAEGEVYLPAHGILAQRAGKAMHAHQMPVADFAKSGLEAAEGLRASYEAALREQRFAIIVDTHDGFLERYPLPGLLERHYRPVGPALERPQLLAPIEGYPVRPGAVWLPRRAGAP